MDELYVLARRVLLDALEALGPHRPAVVLVGAQAIYLRVAESDLAVQPYTTDGDLAIDPSILADTPPLEKALKSAGFSLQGDAVGIWVTPRRNEAGEPVDVMVDLLVPASASPGKGRRAARLPFAKPAMRSPSIESTGNVAGVPECVNPSESRDGAATRITVYCRWAASSFVNSPAATGRPKW